MVNTPCNTHPERVKIVHPAHPLCGQQVTVQRVLREGQKHYLLVKWPDNGQVCRIPQAWTDQAITVPATPCARFTPQQLSTVRQWLDAHLAVTLDGEVKGVSLEEKLTTSGGNTHENATSSGSATGPLASAVPSPTAATTRPAREVDPTLLEKPPPREKQRRSANRRTP